MKPMTLAEKIAYVNDANARLQSGRISLGEFCRIVKAIEAAPLKAPADWVEPVRQWTTVERVRGSVCVRPECRHLITHAGH